MASESGSLGLNAHHEAELVHFLRWSRTQRGARLRAVAAVVEDAKRSRLTESTLTRDEVEELLSELASVLEAELGSELINTAHTSLLLLRQMCGQAEAWHLKLSANLSELENAELLKAVGAFEDSRLDLSASKARPAVSVLKKLSPLPSPPQQQMAELAAENRALKEKLAVVERAAVGVAGERAGLSQRLQSATAQLAAANQPSAAPADPAALAQLEAQMRELEAQLKDTAAQSATERSALSSDLATASQRFLQVKEQLEMTEKELEAKFASTAAYRNLKQMLTKKNGQIKELRSKLAAHEPPDPDDED